MRATPRQCRAVAQYHAHLAIARGAAGIGIEDILAKLRQRARGSRIGEVRTELSASTADRMASAAAGLAPEQGFPRPRVTGHDRLDRGCGQRTDKGYHLPELVFVESGRRHAAGRDAFLDDLVEHVLIDRMPVNLFAQIGPAAALAFTRRDRRRSRS